MIQRCENPNKDGYEYYGGKGITVCNEWHDYENFKKWSLEQGYSDNLTIDRIDYNRGYSPDNCRWATYKTQANNKTDNHMITYNGETKNVQIWGEELGIKPNTIITRLKRGWSVESALSCEFSDCRVLSEEDVEYIKSNYIPRKVSAQKMADKFGVSKKAILNILHNKTYLKKNDAISEEWMYSQCRQCDNKYSSYECEMCEDLDMFKE